MLAGWSRLSSPVMPEYPLARETICLVDGKPISDTRSNASCPSGGFFMTTEE